MPVTARSFSYLAQTFAYRIKDSAFREEQEWRLIYARDPKGPVETATREFRSGARGLVPFVSIPMCVSAPVQGRLRLDLGLSRLPFREVRVGPRRIQNSRRSQCTTCSATSDSMRCE